MAPEMDSIPDPRDLAFAARWHASIRSRVASNPTAVLDDSTLAPRLFAQVFAERKLWRAVEPATVPLLYDPSIGDVAVVLIPGIYGELFDQEIWTRGMRAVHDRLGLRTFTIPVDGRCSSGLNAARIVSALHDDTRRRLVRGYTTPRYLLVGYSKGGIDATEALLLDRRLASEQVAALVSIATPHRGTPVA
jgi:triacylglycerol esterase/lipase EstA (alpha/beta hydrolase family)